MAIVSYTLEEAKKLPDLTDWNRVLNMKDEDIDYSDAPEWTDEDFARATRYGKPLKQPKSVTLKLNPFIVNKLQETGKNWHKRLNEGVENWLLQGGLAKVGVL